MKYTKSGGYNEPDREIDIPVLKYSLYTFGALIAIIAFFVLLSAGLRAYGRYQKRADAHNDVSVTHIKIQQAQQQAQINRAQIAATAAEAQKRYVQSVGVRRAQDEIQSTLTPLYVQWEAVQAQLAMAHSENHTMIWAPAGTNGTPLQPTLPVHP